VWKGRPYCFHSVVCTKALLQVVYVNANKSLDSDLLFVILYIIDFIYCILSEFRLDSDLLFVTYCILSTLYTVYYQSSD